MLTRFVLAVSLAVAAAAQAPPGAEGRVVSLKGSLAARTPGGETRNLRMNDTVEAGFELVTGENSEAVIQAASGSEVRVFPDSRVVYSGPETSLRGLIELLLGSVKVKIAKISGRPNPRHMTTPTAVIAVRGTEFSVFVDEDGDTMVAVDEGLVSVANRMNPSDSILLREHERTWIRRGARPTPVRGFRGPSEGADALPGLRVGQNAVRGAGASGSAPGRGRAAKAEHGPPPGPPGLNRRP